LSPTLNSEPWVLSKACLSKGTICEEIEGRAEIFLRLKIFFNEQTMQLQDVLFSQGFGTRRICQGLIQHGLVEIGITGESQVCSDPWQSFEVGTGFSYVVQSQQWHFWDKAYVMLHKPAGTECSQKPSSWPSIYTLLPAPLRNRPQKSSIQGVQAVGRLDQDTTGLLLLTDDGPLIHRLSSPKHHVPKIYNIVTEDVLLQKDLDQLLLGVVLNDSPKPVKAEHCELSGERSMRMTLTQGKYHQVKRMLAAVGHLVVQLHRSQIGQLRLPEDLLPGQWRIMTSQDLADAQNAN
jgi:16S rRNA pseudouridine516 synthase